MIYWTLELAHLCQRVVNSSILVPSLQRVVLCVVCGNSSIAVRYQLHVLCSSQRLSFHDLSECVYITTNGPGSKLYTCTDESFSYDILTAFLYISGPDKKEWEVYATFEIFFGNKCNGNHWHYFPFCRLFRDRAAQKAICHGSIFSIFYLSSVSMRCLLFLPASGDKVGSMYGRRPAGVLGAVEIEQHPALGQLWKQIVLHDILLCDIAMHLDSSAEQAVADLRPLSFPEMKTDAYRLQLVPH